MTHFFVWSDGPRPKLTYKFKIGLISDKTFLHKNEAREWKIHSGITNRFWTPIFHLCNCTYQQWSWLGLTRVLSKESKIVGSSCLTSVELLMPTEASSRLLTTSVSMAFKPIPFSDDYQPKSNFILEELWKHLLELLRADDSLFVPNSIQRYTIYIQSILLSLTPA